LTSLTFGCPTYHQLYDHAFDWCIDAIRQVMDIYYTVP